MTYQNTQKDDKVPTRDDFVSCRANYMSQRLSEHMAPILKGVSACVHTLHTCQACVCAVLPVSGAFQSESAGPLTPV